MTLLRQEDYIIHILFNITYYSLKNIFSLAPIAYKSKYKYIIVKGRGYQLEITRKDLTKYLSTILKLETHNRTLSITESYLKKRIHQLEHTCTTPLPEKEQVKVEIVPNTPSTSFANVCYVFLIVMGAFILLLAFDHQQEIAPLVIGPLIAFAGIMGMFHSSTKKEREYDERLKKARQEAELKFSQACEEYQKKRDLEREMLEREISKIEPDLAMIHQLRLKTKSLLKQYYGLNIIHKSYRDIIPIASFYHYLSTGICSELEGPDGCYRLYEWEVLQKIIIAKLDQVIEQLEILNERQSELKEALMSSNAAVKELTSYVRGIGNENRQHHAIMQYNQQRIEEEIHFQNQYNRMKDWLDSRPHR